MSDEGDKPRIAPEHLDELVKGSAISLDVLERAGIWSEYDPKACAKLLGRAPKYWEGRVPAWIVPYRVPFHRDPVRHRGKPLKPFETTKPDGSVSLAKYVEMKGSQVHLYFGPSLLEGRPLKDAGVPLWVTEGEKKALSAESAGLSCVAVSGVTQWHRKGERTLHPDFAHIALDGREVFLAFDRDALRNAQVAEQERALGRALLAAGAKVYVVRFPEDAPKLDDFLVRHERSELDALMRDARENGVVADEVKPQGAPAPATACTDLGNAERFVKQHGQDVRYCDELGRWSVWDGRAWRTSDAGQMARRAMRTARSIYEQADGLAIDDERMAMRAWAAKSESRERLAAMVSLAGSFKTVSTSAERFDSDQWSLNVENGIVDLRTGELRPHAREALCTRVAPTHYDPAATDERWLDFLEHVSNGNAEVVDFLQRAVGYSLTGDTREDRLFFLYGPPARGKSTFVRAIETAISEYARTADITSFLATPNAGGDKPRPDLVRLAGARVVVCKEIDSGAKLAEGLVKTITGGDTITIRTLHRAPFEMRPTFKLWLVANDPPVVRGDDAGMWRRIVRIPFERGFERPDVTFRESLGTDRALRSAVLAWAVAGVRKWLERGLEVPEAIAASTAEYRAEMDPLGEFLDTFVVFESGARVARKELRARYENWCKEEGHSPVGARRLAAALKERARRAGLDDHDLSVCIRDGQSVVNGWRDIRMATDLELEVDRRWGRRSVGSSSVVGTNRPLQHFSPVETTKIDREQSNQTLLVVPTVPKVPTEEEDKELAEQNQQVGETEAVGTSVGTSAVVGTFEAENPEFGVSGGWRSL